VAGVIGRRAVVRKRGGEQGNEQTHSDAHPSDKCISPDREQRGGEDGRRHLSQETDRRGQADDARILIL